MKKAIFLSLSVTTLLLTSLYFYSYKSENVKYKILNEIIKDEDLTLFKICSQADNIELTEEILAEFNFLERLSLRLQSLIVRKGKIQDAKIKYFNKRTQNYRTVDILKNCNKQFDFFYKISLPLVFSDGNKVLIKITEDCNCMLGGQGGEYLYKRSDGKWKRVKSFDTWIS